MSNKIWVYVDHFKGAALPASWEAIGAGLSLAEQFGGGVASLVLGSGMENVVQSAFHYGAEEVLLADDPTLMDYRPEPYAATLAKIAAERQPAVIIFPTTTRGRELAAMAAVDLNTGVLVDVVELGVVDGLILATRPIYAGKLLSKVQCSAQPQIVTLRVRAFPKAEIDETRSGTVTEVAVALSEDEITTTVLGYSEREGGVSLNDASVIVSGGRGVSNNPSLKPPDGLDESEQEKWRARQGFKLVEELADVLGGAVGASRAAVDAGYVPYARQVGQTGKVVSPDLYIACGISGAIQHLAGMRTSKMIVAINKDSDAPIFKLARFGVVGDLYSILPPLIEQFRQRLDQ
jgi:electron transfer flavoprotein alpha subunit